MADNSNAKQATAFKGKIAVATDDGRTITGHLGRCRSFMVFEIDGSNVSTGSLRENLFTHHRMGQHHAHHHGEEKDRHGHVGLIEGLGDCRYLISRGGGWRVVEDLRQNNIKTLFTNVELIDDAVKKFIHGALENLDELVCDGKE